MAMYRVYRMKDAPRQQFRWAPHVAGAASVRAKDYEPGDEVQADSEYDAWSRLRASERPLDVGDLLETEGGALRICKYVGFDANRQMRRSELRASSSDAVCTASAAVVAKMKPVPVPRRSMTVVVFPVPAPPSMNCRLMARAE